MKGQPKSFWLSRGGGSVGGRQATLKTGDFASIQFTTDSVLEAWSCTCGTWECDRRHRISGWNPLTASEEETLTSFVWNALKGANKGFNVTPFITGMYYALLCDGD